MTASTGFKENDTIQEQTNRPIEKGALEAPPLPSGGETEAQYSHELTGLFTADERSLSFTGNALTILAKARTRGIVNPVTKDSLSIGDVIIASSIASRIGIGEAKLLRYGVSAFTKENAQNERKPILRIYGDTKDFARANGVKIDPQQMATKGEQGKENRRAAKALENFVAKLARNAETLNNASFSWMETVKGKAKSYSGVSLIGAYKIDSSVIMLEFTQSAAEYMTQLPLSDTPRALYAVDDRKPNAYSIAQALITHYGMENNVIRNTERMLKVETLLAYTSFRCKDGKTESKNKLLSLLYSSGVLYGLLGGSALC